MDDLADEEFNELCEKYPQVYETAYDDGWNMKSFKTPPFGDCERESLWKEAYTRGSIKRMNVGGRTS